MLDTPELFTDFDEERAITARRVETNNTDQLALRVKYLEKDNKDLEMDLEDVDATLQINKSIINSLVDARQDWTQAYKSTIQGFQSEIAKLEERLKRYTDEREALKAKLLMQDQIRSNFEAKEKEIAHGFELEHTELREQLEKKEFTLQLLEQRLFDVELFLRKWGREDANI